MRESKIEKEVTKYAKVLGWLSYKFVSPNQKGIPDRLYLRDSVLIFVEFKQEGKEPTKLQAKCIKSIRNQGFNVIIIDNIEKGIKFFNTFE